MLFAALLACVGVMQAQVAYRGTNRTSTLEEGKKYMIYNATNAQDGWGSRAGVYYNANGKLTIDASLEPKTLVTHETKYLWEVIKGSNENEYSIKSVSSGEYVAINGTISGTTNTVYVMTWSDALEAGFAATGDAMGFNNEAGERIKISEYKDEDCLFTVASSTSGGTCWNGNPGSFATWSSAHPITFYEVVEEVQTVDLTALTNKINKATAVLTDAGYTFAIGDAVALQTDNADAAGYLSVSHPAIDEDVLAGAIDKDDAGNANLNTLYHSDWTAAVSTPYMQVDLGTETSLNAFVLTYSTRQSGNNGSPYAITVSGSNNGEDFTAITELSRYDAINALPSTNAKTYTGVFVADEAYRYLRFTVTSSANGNNSFGVSNFGINKVTVEGAMTGTKMRYATIYKAILDATAMANNEEAYQEDVDAAAAYLENLLAVTTAECPFELTTDLENPVCYVIKSSRANQGWNNPCWALSGNGVKINEYDSWDAAAEDFNAYWYFVEDKNTGLLTMYPYLGESAAMGYKAEGDDRNKLTMVASEYAGIRYQLVVKGGDYPYALKPYGYNTYVSNFGGKGNLMGFYKDVEDHGTRFALEKVEAPSAKLAELSIAIDEARQYENKGGASIGLYSEASIAALIEAITAAQAVYDNPSSTAAACDLQVEALRNAIAELTINLPVPGKFYRLKNAVSNNYMSGNANNITLLTNGSAVASTVFYLGEGNTLLSYASGLYLDCNAKGYAAVGTSQQGEFGLAYGGATANVITYKNNGYWTFGNRTEGQGLDRGMNNPNQAGYNWIIEEVAWLPIAMNATVGWATFYSPVQLELSYNRVKAYTGLVEGNVVKLHEQSVVPANTGVILELQQGAEVENGHVFLEISKSENVVVEDNDLDGTFADTYVAEEAYVLSAPNGAESVGLYKATLNQQGNTSFLNQGFKAYLPASAKTAGAPMFSFERGEGTTEIENSELRIDNSVVIYDLAGRRVEKMEKGIYIVNGKKVVIK